MQILSQRTATKCSETILIILHEDNEDGKKNEKDYFNDPPPIVARWVEFQFCEWNCKLGVIEQAENDPSLTLMT